MRPGTKIPLNKKYFHTKSKLDKRDLTSLKRKVGSLNIKKYKKMLKNNDPIK